MYRIGREEMGVDHGGREVDAVWSDIMQDDVSSRGTGR